MSNLRVSDQVALVGVIDPDVTVASEVVSGWIAAADFAAFQATVIAGTLGSSATVDAKIEQATDGSGTGKKDISGAAITQMTQAGTDQSDTEASIGILAGDLDVANDFTHIQFAVTVGTATSDISGFVIATNPRVAPADDNDVSTVGEIVNV